MQAEQKLKDLDINLPKIAENNDLPFSTKGVIVDKLVYLSGQTTMIDGEMKITGTVGSAVTVEIAQEAAEVCTLNLISALKDLIGDLNKVKRIVKLTGYVASDKDFDQQAKVINGASNLLNSVFGGETPHARAAIGVAALPGGTSVEAEMIVELNT
ncbi:RidA family protein [Salicibibacter cibi]|uniref:RidA family protein n=1 Tax=Salicibibacter cibi TaxID=2743001 RepID=A0A7T6Z8K1_9BACI|nr:RidA family protein [Salicibibacter cibi]QQK78863.1 RidA family protein [Salicibibacter cibi]